MSYLAVVLNEESQALLKGYSFHREVPDYKNWQTQCHHMTIAFGKWAPEQEALIGEEVLLFCDAFGFTDKTIAVRVKSARLTKDCSAIAREVLSTNKVPHITMWVNRAQGCVPVNSNLISNYDEHRIPGIPLKGIVKINN